MNKGDSQKASPHFNFYRNQTTPAAALAAIEYANMISNKCSLIAVEDRIMYEIAFSHKLKCLLIVLLASLFLLGHCTKDRPCVFDLGNNTKLDATRLLKNSV